jgi:hypothetical protein
MALAAQKGKIAETVRTHIAAAFRELLSDPDAGQILRPAFEARLRKSVKSARTGRTKSFADVFRRYRV